MPDERLKSLEGILAKKPRERLTVVTDPDRGAAEEPVTPAVGAPAVGESGTGATSPGPRPAAKPPASRRKPTATPRKPNATAARARVAVRLEPDLRRRLEAAAAARDASMASVLFDAVEAYVAAGDFRGLHLKPAPPSSSGLFIRTESGPASPTVGIEFYMTASDQRVLDGLVAEHEAPTRTAFIVAALEHHLR